MKALDVCADLPDMAGKEMGLHSGVDSISLLWHINLERKGVRKDHNMRKDELMIALTGVIGIEDMVMSKKVVERVED